MKKSPFIIILGACALLSGCKVYRSYERPANLPTDSLYRDPATGQLLATADTVSFGNRPWREVFTDPQLQSLIETALAQNNDLRQAQLTLEQAQYALKPARLAYFPSLSFTPQGTVSSFDMSKATQTYSLPIAASWQFGSIGSLRNTKKQAETNVFQAEAQKQAVQTSLISSVANMYYTLLMLDEQLKLTKATAEIWKENVETMKAMQVAAMTNSAAVSQSEANYQGILATIPTLEQSIRSTENALCSILHEAPHSIARGQFAAQQFPADLTVGVPMQLLSNRPDVKVAEMNLTYVKTDFSQDILPQILQELYDRKIQTLLVEGGSRLLQSFIDDGLWDEIYIEQARTELGTGVEAPHVPSGHAADFFLRDNVVMRHYVRSGNQVRP